MDDKTVKEVEAMLAKEREEMLRQQSLVSWLRAWLWLMLVEKKSARQWHGPATRHAHAPLLARLRVWFSRPFRAWAAYRYAKLDEEVRERIEDAWLTRTLNILKGNRVSRSGEVIGKAVVGPAAFRSSKRAVARMPAGSSEFDGDSPFVKYIMESNS